MLGGSPNGGLGANDDHKHDGTEHDDDGAGHHHNDHRHASGRPGVLGAGEPGSHVRRRARKGCDTHRRTVAHHHDDRPRDLTTSAAGGPKGAGANGLAQGGVGS